MSTLPEITPNTYRSIDTLCGGGGMSLAHYLAGFKLVSVINHAVLAIDSHKVMFPRTKHFVADFLTQHAEALGLADYFHSSPDCRDHSRAKNGRPLDPSVRGLAGESPRYLLACDAKIATFENVPEFLDWGPLMELRDEQGTVQYGIDKESGEMKPLLVKDKSRNGEYYRRWVATMRALGYVNHQHRILNSADYGSPQARRRYFGIFTRAGIPITWPPKTHDEFGRGGLPKWRSSLSILEPGNYGESVFGKDYVENTLYRMAEGVERFGKTWVPWMLKYVSNPPSGKFNPGYSTLKPLHTLTGQRCPLLVQPFLLDAYYKSGKCIPVSRPLQTLRCKAHFGVLTAVVPAQGFSIGTPFPGADGKVRRLGFFHYYSGGGQLSSLQRPLPALLTNGHARLLSGIYASGQPGEKVLDKPGDTPAMLRLKAACRQAGIVDLRARMLTVRESFRGQGFPDWYTLLGTETQQRKMIGNAVEVNTGLAVANEVRKMLDRFAASGRTLVPLKMRPVIQWEQGEIFQSHATGV